MTPHEQGSPAGRAPTMPGPTISFGFNLGKVPDHGEDSDPILRDGPDLGLVGVFDGMGGAGGTLYETPEGRRTGAYLASRIARDVVEQRMLDLLEPDWNLNGQAAAEDLHGSVQHALQERLEELKAPKSGLRSKLLRALPTTMAVVALQRTQPGGSTWACHMLWAGDSRAYVFEPSGVRQLTTDDLRDPGDALVNLRADSVVSNALSADTEFHVNYRRVELEAPFLVACATDGCFGYMPTPMHFEHLILGGLATAGSPSAWSNAVQARVSEVTGDDAAMAMLGVGATLGQFRDLFAPRLRELEEEFIRPIDDLRDAIAAAEEELGALRQRHVDTTTRTWSRYKPTYEQYLVPSSDAGAERDDQTAAADAVDDAEASPDDLPHGTGEDARGPEAGTDRQEGDS